tara:strand:+ start:1170 stop:2003 length:834 start_codon:yes stop_codon:yes gene_type:complete
MKKIISFSLWGDNPNYVIGAVLNADIAEKEWPDWICRFYVAPTVPSGIIEELKSRDNVEVIEMDEDESWNGMFWRFYPASETEVDIAIFRDADARLHTRDKAAVDEWIASDKGVHIMRDMCQHGWVICGGLWGTKRGAIPRLKYMIKDEVILQKEEFNKHGVDQIFLQYAVYKNIVNDALIHDDWHQDKFTYEEKHPFPIPRLRGEGWWNEEFPEWHGGIEDDPDKYPHWFGEDGAGHCFYKCPACGVYHDNEYLGKVASVTKEEQEKYFHLLGVKV